MSKPETTALPEPAATVRTEPQTAAPFELGLSTFGELIPGPGQGGSPRQRLADLLEEAQLADQLGLDVFAIGEHHRADYLVSSPEVLLSAISARTQGLRLSSAVTVLSSDDPVRVFQRFATLDLISGGRAEIMAGRGSFTESFPLFGYGLQDYDELFDEKLDLLLQLREQERPTWQGKHRAPLNGQGVYPRPLQQPLPVWIAVGGTPASADRAGRLGLPMVLAIIGGTPARFAPFAQIHRRAAAASGHDPARVPLAINTHAFVAKDARQAADVFFPPYATAMNRIGRERGWSGISREQYQAALGPHGHLLVGDPAQVAEKILAIHQVFGNQRFLAQFSVGTVPHADMMRSIELFGTEVAPLVRREVAARTRTAPAADDAAAGAATD